MHKPVLLKESLDILDLQDGDVYLDATLGEGGHTREVWERFGERVKIIGLDADKEAGKFSKGKFFNLNFRNIEELREEKPNKILFDLGWSKRQFDPGEGEPKRGFSFQKDEPLLMTFGEPSQAKFTAYDIVNSWDKENIETILTAYGEEKFAMRIAERIVGERLIKPIKTSGQLAEIVKLAVPVWYRFRKIHPATKTFQALRIAVNDELTALGEGLNGAFEILQVKGRIAVISFHSLEDRIVKRKFKDLAERNEAKILTKRPIVATREEILENPRGRSAKLRAIEKIY